MAEAAEKKKEAEPEIQRTPAESTAVSLGHTVRWEMQAALHTGERSATELGEIVGLIPQTAAWHIKALLKAGLIELAETIKGNQHIYRAVSTDSYTDEEFAELPVEARREHTRLILTWLAAEMFAAWQAGTMLDDPFLFLVWDWGVKLDQQGREEWKAERERNKKAREEIHARSLERQAQSDEEPVTVVYADVDFIRSPRVSGPPFRS